MQAVYSCSLFKNWQPSEVDDFLKCVHHHTVSYQKNDIVFHKGDEVRELGIVIHGSLLLQDHDFWGNCFLLTNISTGEIFGETFACLHQPIHIEVQAKEASQVLFLSPEKMMQADERLTQRFIQLLANKNLVLTNKIRHVTMRSTQSKVLSYLSDVAWIQQSNTFDIPYNRQQLADYLAVERSALSIVLSNLAKQGYLTYHKNHFTLLKKRPKPLS